ncbi:MAG: hypothetical protein JRI23_30220, partial [Deltaproteobacteria bacterium]|nr:hypothetical protein [Deltaproteobacteria bacterium]MBW2536445.1 hypothetical protein [Deltaproteobacteria bacterium]
MARCATAAAADREDGLARLVLLWSVSDQAARGLAEQALASLRGVSPRLQDQARWLARQLRPASGSLSSASTAAAPRGDVIDEDGLVRSYAVLGPFEDVGGGLDRREGPESAGHDYRRADYSWGAYVVRYGHSLPAAASARGLDLDLHVEPRKESCSYLESVLHWPRGANGSDRVILLVASSGAFRLSWDGLVIARRDEQHRSARLDRAAVELPFDRAEHLLRLKVCSGALADDGRVRVRFVDSAYRSVAVASTSQLDRLAGVAAGAPGSAGPGAPGAPKARPVSTALELGLDAPRDSTPGRALVSAVLRALGGAEDLQSSRVPGLLDRAVQSSRLRVDELALAGAIAPSGADRSGWLHQAYQRALATGDRSTASFALRELLRWRLRAGLHEAVAATAA